MKDYENKSNMKYAKGMGLKGNKLMKSHGNVQKVKSDSQKYDMGRMQHKGHEYKGYNDKAFDYKY